MKIYCVDKFCTNVLLSFVTLSMLFLRLNSDELNFQFDHLNIELNNVSGRCFGQTCKDGTFCAPIGFLDGYYGNWLPYGTCMPCALCLCDRDAIDQICPINTCPRGEFASIISLQGSFYNSQSVPNGQVCISIWVFEGQTFRQASFYMDLELYVKVAADTPEQVENPAETQCSELHGGLKSGVFEVGVANEVTFMYTDGYDFEQNTSFIMRGIIVDDCPHIILSLNRSSIPVSIEVAHWSPRAAAVQAYEFVNSTKASCDGGVNSPGYCLQSQQQVGRSIAELRLLRLTGIVNSGAPLNAVLGPFTPNGWRRDVISPIQFFANGSLCTLVLEQSALTPAMVYIRSQVYGCSEPVSASSPAPSTSAHVTMMGTASRPGTSEVPSVTQVSTTTAVAAQTTTKHSASFLHTTSTLIAGTLAASGSCRNYGNLSVLCGSAASPYVLNCPSGKINILDYAPKLDVNWEIDVRGTVAIWLSSLFGFGVNVDYINITSLYMPNLFITGASSDPTSNVLIKQCFYEVNCMDNARFFTAQQFNQSFTGPLWISFVSSGVSGNGGAVIEYASITDTAQARSWAPVFASSSQSIPPSLNRRLLQSSGAMFPCACGIPQNDSCQSPFFQSPVCQDALATWSWLAFHRPFLLSTANITILIDAVVYFERFQNFQASNDLFVTASFEIYSANISHYLDVIALFKGPDEDQGSCDQYRTFSSCSRLSPLSYPPTLQNQLCWAYTSALTDPWSNVHVPIPGVSANAGSVDFCSDVTESAGPGVYYVLLYSFRLKQVIAQIDYIQSRDCYGVSFPCSPQLLPNPNRIFDNTGPLAVCPVMWFRDPKMGCVPCPSGTFSGTLNSPSCFACPSGMYFAYPYLGLQSCALCSGVVNRTDPAIAVQCKSNTSLNLSSIPMSTSSVKLSTAPVETTSSRYCGDGMLFYDGVFSGKQCDSGTPGQFSSGSSFVSIFTALGTPEDVRNDLQQFYQMCNRVTCKLMTSYCGDLIVTPYTPIYSPTACQFYNYQLVCGENSDLKYMNKTVVYNEECDDGNFFDGDGCSNQCTVEALFRCSLTVCLKTCPNGIVDYDTGEHCDDGNNINGDGCSSTCQIECGWVCAASDPSARSICTTVCGDGIIAGSEQCDIALIISTPNNPDGQGCNSYCRVENGWICNQPISKCITNITSYQSCSPICGDGLLTFPEECDDMNWNLEDKACLPNCRINRDRVCYGSACLLPIPLPGTVLDNLVPILQSDGLSLAEGIFALGDIFFSNTSVLSRTKTMFVSKYSSSPVSFPSMLSSFSILPEMIAKNTSEDPQTSILTGPFCTKPPDTTLSAVFGEIYENWKFLANNVSCSYKLSPSPPSTTARFLLLQMTFPVLELYGDSYLEIVSSEATTSQTHNIVCKYTAPFLTSDVQGPVYLLAPVEIFLFGAGQSTHLQYVSVHALNVNIKYSTLNNSVSEESILCLSLCQCNRTCGRNCFEKTQFRLVEPSSQVSMSSSNVDTLPVSEFRSYNPFQDTNEIVGLYPAQIIAIDFDSSNLPWYDLTFPPEFSQYPDISILESMTEDAKSWIRALEQSWRGHCYYRLTDSYSIICNVVVHISRSTIIKHVWNCPLRGSSVGRIIEMDMNASDALDSSFMLSYYRNGKLIWTKAGIDDVPNKVSRFMIGSGYVKTITSDISIQIALEGATEILMGAPQFEDFGVFPQEGNCRILDLAPYPNMSGLTQIQSSAPQTDVDAYLLCNQSLAQAIKNLQDNSNECLALVRALLMRDFWAPLDLDITVLNSEFESEYIADFACKSSCKDFFISEMQSSTAICASAWTGSWSSWSTASRTFKLLISIATSIYWYSVMCTSNQAGNSCASYYGLTNTLFSGSFCPPLLNQSLFSPQFELGGFVCNSNCSEALVEYVNVLGCCSSSIQFAGAAWLETLTNPTVSTIKFDFGDRSNPFNSTFPQNGEDTVIILFDTQGGLNILQSGLESNRKANNIGSAFQIVESECQGCNWPYLDEQCCNTITCVNGNKSFDGSCSCVCPAGWQGAQCNVQGYFAQAILHFNVIATSFPGKYFSYCQLKAFYSVASTTFGVSVDDIDFEPMISSQKRELSSGLLALFRIRVSSCSDAERTTQKISSLSDDSVVTLFVAQGVPKPVISSVWAYCDGKQTTCGESAEDGSVSAQVVFAACTAGLGANISEGSASSPEGAAISSIAWKLPALACGLAIFTCMLGVLLMYCRVRIARNFIWTYKALKEEGVKKMRNIKNVNPTGKIIPEADMVFDKNINSAYPSQLYIMNQFEPKDIELKFMFPYVSQSDVSNCDISSYSEMRSGFDTKIKEKSAVSRVSDCLNSGASELNGVSTLSSEGLGLSQYVQRSVTPALSNFSKFDNSQSQSQGDVQNSNSKKTVSHHVQRSVTPALSNFSKFDNSQSQSQGDVQNSNSKKTVSHRWGAFD